MRIVLNEPSTLAPGRKDRSATRPSESPIRRTARDATRVAAFGFGARGTVSDDPSDARPLFVWGWLPIVVSCAAIVVVTMFASEALLERMGYSPDPAHRLVLIVRGTVVSALLAAWSGWYVLRTRRRIEAAHAALVERQHALQAAALRAEQAAGLGASARILANELRSPLNTIALQTELLKRRAQRIDGASEAIGEVVDALGSETRRMTGLIDDYIAYARAADVVVTPTSVQLESVVNEVVASYADVMRERGIAASVVVAPGLPAVRADQAKLGEAISQIVRRACESLAGGGAIRFDLEEDAPCVRLVVRDDGPGFADPSGVFRPFFATGDVGGGFALAIARDIVRAHGGEISAWNVGASGGGCVAIRLPKAVTT